MIGGELDDDDAPSLDLTNPHGLAPRNEAAWTLVAHNKSILKAWDSLCRNTPEDAQHCYAWLSRHATRQIPRRCYPLKGKPNAGCWGYEIGSGNRVYYKPDDQSKRAVIYYAGPHPKSIPSPPKGL
jgi:hypothetical protein